MEPDTKSTGVEGSAKVESIILDSCRSCSSAFVYSAPEGGFVTIIIGIPSENLEYKAISHVWGPYNLVSMHCKTCSTMTHIRLRSIATFRNIMALAGPGSRVWMDNMSIDQSDPSDVAAQVAVMGDIYSKATCVSVLLFLSDKEAYEAIANIVTLAKILLERKGQFDYNPEDKSWEPQPGEEIAITGKFARNFFKALKSFQDELCKPKYEYWMRAWTFQEWATSFDIEIAIDVEEDSVATPPTLQKVKSTVVYAAIMIANYKLKQGQYALMDLGFSRGFCRPYLEDVKRLFPFERAFLSFEEISESKTKARLNLMLDSFGSGPRRNATFEADLVCCWASMCNISYDYSKDDTLDAALTKIIRALRSRGNTIYNFIPNGFSAHDDMLFTDVLSELASSIQDIPFSSLKSCALVIVAIPLEDGPKARCFHAWTICSADVIAELDSVYVAREDLNGTLVLAKPTSNNTLYQETKERSLAGIVSYLTITDHECGTFLLPVSTEGQLDLDFKTHQRPDISNSEFSRDRKLSAVLKLEESNSSLEISSLPVPKEVPVIVDSESSWESLKMRAASGDIEFTSNEEAVEQVGEDRSVILDILKEIAKRSESGTSDGSGFERDGRGTLNSLLDIDIGHPELIDQQTEKDNKKRHNGTIKRSDTM